MDIVAMNKKWRCPSGRTFFGLNHDYMESVFEQFFILKHHGGWGFTEAYNLPIKIRLWFLKRLVKHFEEEKEEYEKMKKKQR